MSYIYVVTKGIHILGATTRKYELKNWKSYDYKDDSLSCIPPVFVERFCNGISNGKSVKFTLKEFLQNPKKQFKAL